MTAFLTSDIPPSVNTVEELAVWALTILNELYPDQTVVESPGRANKVVDCAPFYLDSSTPPGWVMIGRCTLPMQASWRQNAKPWAMVQEIGTSAIPSGYKS